MNRFGLIATWVTATALTTVLAWQIVAAAGEQVSPGPLTPIAAPVTTSTTGVSTTLPAPSSSSSTTTAEPGLGSTTSSSTPSSGSSTTVAVSWQVKTIPTVGGTVVVSYRPGEVVLDGATPAPGFTVESDKQGPPDVKVEFNSESTRVEVEVKWDDTLVIDVREDGEEEED
ncbi:MAG TPA: hypothetical protein VJA46_05265 [Acidimicrobiia bacterium]|nr:hypothetical protein [Acidimicrobiia bacterium]